ncbi:NAD-dependent dihydropyrimidine dehydrogenase subunit PreA [Pendulispora brunnea]|uniref:dihydrouracil dehydrogenase (NAD(+)) n=1 Tax=Pendulispora brunnea TaxID=2905690 RepID=A0ABZ2K3K3_9BACT
MADLSIDFAGIKSPNPFWLASAPPANSGEQIMRAFDAGWGGAVWKTLGDPIVNVSSRFGALDYGGQKVMGFTNIELISDRPLEDNLREVREVKKRYPKHAVVVSVMTETRDDWRVLIRRCEDAGADGLELNFGCPHGMCERGMGSSVGQEPRLLEEITSWAKEFAKTPVLVKLTPNVGDILEPGRAGVRGGADGLSLVNTFKSIISVDLDRMVPEPRVGMDSTNGGYCGPAVKPIALHMVASLARDPRIGIPLSGIGGISNWRDAAEFIALGCTSVQVCTAVMHYGFRIVEDMIDGLSNYLDERGMKSVNDLRGRAVRQFREWGELDLGYQLVARIDSNKCIGCQLCVSACHDGAHQCIFTGTEDRKRPPHAHAPHVMAKAPQPQVIGAVAGTRVPWVDEPECVGCNLCALVCPVPECITMEQTSASALKGDTWNRRVQEGRNKVPGGIHEF